MKRLIKVFSLAAALQLAIPAPAMPSTEGSEGWSTPFVAAYDFYIGGLPIAEIEISGALSPDGYDATSSVLTRGILEVLVQGRVNAQAKGARHNRGHLTPHAYATIYSTRSERHSVSMSYDDEVPVSVSIKPVEPPKPYDTKASEHAGALDPVTAATTVMTPDSVDDLCNRTIPVFDGKRRYDLILLPVSRRPKGNEPPKPTWDSPMVRCFGVYERIAGFEPELQVNQRYYPFDIWFENDGDRVFRPVRVAGKTRLGFAIGNLRK